MDLRFLPPQLAKLDLAATEVLVVCLCSDERPPRGVAGLVDWRMAGRLSALIQRGLLTGRPGEVVLLPGKPKLPFDKVVLFGLGERSEFSEDLYKAVVCKVLATLEGLKVRNAVVQLPGRHNDAIAPERAADILLEAAGGDPAHDVWTLVEPPEAQRAITQHMIQERRRVRQG
jgi:hypothetical protein